MNDRFREFGYEITADAGFMHELFNIPRELVRQIEENYHRISSGNFGNKTIENINKLIEKYPQNPQLKNLLFSALMTRGEVQEARNYNRKILEEHPGYLFGKLNLAGEYFENGEYDRMTEALGEVMEIQDLYPERDKFHLSEVIGFNRMAVLYFTAKNNMEAAESRLEIMEKIAPDHPDTMDARMRLLEAGMEKFREGEKKRIRVKTAEKVDVEQTTKEPEFTHEEIGLLYRHGVGIGKEYLDRILALPRDTLIRDLETVLSDCMRRFDFYQDLAEEEGWDSDSIPFALHPISLLGELKAEESLGKVLHFLRQSEDFIDFWLGGFITGEVWVALYQMAFNRTEELKRFVTEPGLYTFVRTEVGETVVQISLNHPERRGEMIEWFRDVFRFFAQGRIEDNVIDSDAIALMICAVMYAGAEELLPEIEKLFDHGYVSESTCGTFDSIRNDFCKYPADQYRLEPLPVADRYERILSQRYDHLPLEDDLDYEPYSPGDYLPTDPVRRSEKTGRNDPCPCGSGKKYKKCCWTKDQSQS